MPSDRDALPVLALIAGVVAISWSAIFVRWTGMPGVASAFYRVLIASVALWIFLAVRRGPSLSLARRSVPLILLGGLFFAADVGLYNVAVLRTSAGSATFLANNAPVCVGLLTWALTRRLPSARFWISLAIALSGASLILSADWRHLASSRAGDLLALSASLSFALYLVTTEHIRAASGTLITVTLSTSASAVALLAYALATGISLRIPNVHAFLAILGLGLLCQLAGYLCLTYALGHVPATVSSIALLGMAPLTAVLAFFAFHETMTAPQLSGGALILAAVWLITRPAPTRTLPT